MSIESFRRDFAGSFPAGTESLLIWNHLVEPGDRIASALRLELGSFVALEKLRAGNLEATELVTREELTSAFERWSPRLENLTPSEVVSRAVRTDSQLLLPSDPQWPQNLEVLGAFAPMLLWYRGSLSNFAKLNRSVGVVGSRTVSRYGHLVTGDLAASIIAEQGAVISGGALGVDSIAHRVALGQSGVTVAFMAGSLDNLYPVGNSDLFEEIAHSGLLLSEMAPGSKPTRWRFLQRNRLIAALSEAVVVTEAGLRSGSINTANHAIELNRPVFALPGPVTSPTSAGCNRLIRDQKATALLDPRDLPEELGWIDGSLESDPQLGSLELRLLDFLNKKEQPTTELASAAGLTRGEVNLALGSLQLSNRVVRGEKGGWMRNF